MELTLILGPMKSGKSFDLIHYFAPLQYSNLAFELFQPQRNTRDEIVTSRNGLTMGATKIKSLQSLIDRDVAVVGIDEVHMFPEDEVQYIDALIKKGTKVIIAGLDMDYTGTMFGIIKKLLELGPREVLYRRAVCEGCKKFDATYTQVFHDTTPVTGGVSTVIPEDGTYTYSPVCRHCFVGKNQNVPHATTAN